MMKIEKGMILEVDLSGSIGSEQAGDRPVVVIQNNVGNRFSPTIIVAACTTKLKNKLPTHVITEPSYNGFKEKTVICLEQQRTLDKTRVKRILGKLNRDIMLKVDFADLVSKGIDIEAVQQYQKYLDNNKLKKVTS